MFMIVNFIIYVLFVYYLGGQFKLFVIGKFDYEILFCYNVIFMILDGKIMIGFYLLIINVFNVNEECYFDR